MREFPNLGAFIAHLAQVQVAIPAAERRGLRAGAELIRDEARAEIGTYQRAETGLFAPWRELADRTKADRLRLGFTENDPLLRTGDMRDSIHCTIGTHAALIGSNSDVALWQEMGTEGPHPGMDGYHVSPRHFLGVAAFRKGEQAAALIGQHVAWTLAAQRGWNG